MMEDMQAIDPTASYCRPGAWLNPELPRTQIEVIRDIMLSAADCNTWLTLYEISALTRYGEASISAQLRHLRKAKFGSYRVEKRRRELADGAPILRRSPRSRSLRAASRGLRRRRGAPRRSRGRKAARWEYRIERPN